MKILHIAQERGAPLVGAHVLHGIAQNVTLVRADASVSALRWLQDNRDTAAVIVEVEVESCSFVEQLRGLGLTTPVVVVAGSARLEPLLAALNAGADGCVVAGPSFEADLRRTVAEAIDGARGRRPFVTQTQAEVGAEREATEQQPARVDTAAARLADVQARHSVSLARETRICMALQQRLFDLETALRKADERRASEAVSFADQLAKRHAEFTASLAQAAQSRDALAAESGAAAAALDEARQGRKADAAAAAEHLRQREAELRGELAVAAAARTAIDHALAEAEAAHQDTRQRAAIDLAAANERQAALEDLLNQETDRRTSLDRQLVAAETAHQDADRRHAAELAELQARYDAALEENTRARAASERQTADLASLQAQFDTAVTEHTAAHAAMEQRLTDAATAHRQAEDRTAAALEAGSMREAELQAQLVGERTTAAREHAALRHLLDTTQIQLEHLQSTVEEERQAHERARLTSEAEMHRVSAEYGQIRQSFDRLQSAFQTLEQVAGEHAAERARLESVVDDRDNQLTAQAERHRIAEQDAQDALAALQEKLRQAVDAGGSEIARLQHRIEALRRELDATRTHAAALRGVAERVPDLQAQLEQSQNERRRQFERAPYALCRCSQSGAITDANHSFVKLLGCRRVDDLRNVDFVAAARDSAGDLGWLLERARKTRKTETVETHWKTRDGRRRVVRLQALATTTGSIDIVAEDITASSGLEGQLRRAQRMEAVGRLASEVAVTCEAQLSAAARGAHEWLARVGSDDPLRPHAEHLLTEILGAASFLRQLGTYGTEQVHALEGVSADHVIRELAPVLQRLLGDQIELVLPKSAGSFNVDADTERLERVLINVASYARERMPSGGQVRIDLATAILGRRFVTRYSNVRPGDHVLMTVTELPTLSEPRGDSERKSQPDKPGVDLGVLADLIASCGGHLWLEAQPAGHMVVKVHLPKPPEAQAPDNPGGRFSRWFRPTLAAKVRA